MCADASAGYVGHVDDRAPRTPGELLDAALTDQQRRNDVLSERLARVEEENERMRRRLREEGIYP